jgi:hypothetical protein
MQAEAIQQPTLRQVPAWAWLVVAILFLFVYAFAYDQGLLLKAFVGELSEKKNFLHEFFHDGRHLLGFPCH